MSNIKMRPFDMANYLGTEEEIVDAITSQELASIRELRRHTGAGDGCTCCHETLKGYLARYSLAVVCGS